MVETLAASVQATRTDLTQHAAVYFFRSSDPTHELAAVLPALRALADEAPDRGGTLNASIDLLATQLGRDFLDLDGAESDRVLRAFAEDQRVGEEAEALRLRVVGRAG